ncbi:MAG: carboxypeptidase regulatory-like domain-containing protein [Planctomycetota bacterium]|jgi:plastocyanin
MKKLIGLSLAVWMVLGLGAAVWAQGEWGNLKGRIKVEGAVPAPAAEEIDKDQAACMKDGVKPLDDNLVVDKEGSLRDVFVMMLLKPGSDPKVHPSYDEKKTQQLVLDNVNCRFVPHALVVRAGQAITLKNSDDVGHNCHIVTMKNEENVNLPQHGSVEIKLKAADKTPGNVVCDIHKWMDAVILVRDEPYAAVTDEKGNFLIENLPAGKWTFQFWHKKAGYLSGVSVGKDKTGKRGEVEVEIKNGETFDFGQIVVPAASLNK